MLEKPRLKAHLSANVVGTDEVFLLGDDRQHLLEGKAAAQVVPLLDGRRTVAQIALELGGELPLGEVMAVVSALERGGHLAEGNGTRLGTAWWEAAGLDATNAAERVSAMKVAVATVGDVANAPEVAAGLEGAGLSVRGPIVEAPVNGSISFPQEADDLIVVLAEDYLSGTLDDVNNLMLGANRPWLLAKPIGETLWFGPHFRPEETGCWRCLEFRLRRNRHVHTYIEHCGGSPPWHPPATPPGASQLAAGVLARELEALAATGAAPELDGQILSLHRDLETRRHVLIKRPQCPACGAGTAAYQYGEVALSPAPKRLLSSGAWRTATAEETVARLEKHISPITGAIARVIDLSDSDDSGYAFRAAHWFPSLYSAGGAAVLRQNVRGRSGGKGATPAQARASAICESLERYSGCFFGDEPRERGTRTEMADRMVDFEQLNQYSDAQYAVRDEVNKDPVSEFEYVPVPLAPDREIDWTAATSLTSGGSRLAPTAYCFYGHPDMMGFDNFFCAGDSNGQGAGNSLEEAVTQGMLEIVERDGAAIWWYNKLRLPRIDLDSFGSEWLDQVRAEHARAGRELWALDLTTDVGIPVFVAVSRRTGSEDEDLIFGFGAHLEPRLAMTRAVSELNQFLPIVRRDPRSGDLYVRDRAAREWFDDSSLAEDYHLAGAPDGPMRSLEDFPDRSTDDLADDIRTCVDLIANVGLETFVVDQSRPDIELRVVKVLVPGLRPFWRRLAPGRLYDVPVKMGWLERAKGEDEMNPKSIWF